MNPYAVQPNTPNANYFMASDGWILLKRMCVVAFFLTEKEARAAAEALNAIENRKFHKTPGQRNG